MQSENKANTISSEDTIASDDSYSILVHSKTYIPKETEALKNSCRQWDALIDEFKELYYLVLTSPKWYQGSDGRDLFYKDCEKIDSLHIHLNTAPSLDRPYLPRYVYLSSAKALLLSCCQGTIERQLPSDLDEFHSVEQKEEMKQCREQAFEHLELIDGLLDKWIEARDRLADEVSAEFVYVDNHFTESGTSQLLIGLAEIISIP